MPRLVRGGQWPVRGAQHAQSVVLLEAIMATARCLLFVAAMGLVARGGDGLKLRKYERYPSEQSRKAP